MLGKRSPGIYNNVAIQYDVVNAVIHSLGSSFWDALSHKGSVPLTDNLFYAKNKVYACVHVDTVRIWFTNAWSTATYLLHYKNSGKEKVTEACYLI